jgi:hypothetical protein
LATCETEEEHIWRTLAHGNASIVETATGARPAEGRIVDKLKEWR